MKREEDLQTIDFRIRVRMQVGKDHKAKDLQTYLAEEISELDGVIEVKEHSWTRHTTKSR